MEQIGFVYVRV